MNKAELTQEDLSKAIQFLKDNAISPDAVSLERLVGWLNNPISRFNHNSLKIEDVHVNEREGGI